MSSNSSLGKRVAITKANSQMVAVVAVSAFVAVFCLFAAKAVFSQNTYQSRVIKEKEKALSQLKKNIIAFDDLKRHYVAFDATSTNVLGGIPTGTGDNDGNNSKIILDALPANYDFPALTSSVEKVINSSGLKIASITGTDDQLNQQNSSASSSPKAIPIPFTFTVNNANYGSIQQLINKLDQSIRPIQIDKLLITGGANNMSATVEAHTFFQTSKNVSITKKVVK